MTADDIEAINKALCEKDLYSFIKHFWRSIDPCTFVDGWHIRAICEHLEAVKSGEIKKLLITIPPRHMKSIAVSVAFPAWVWTTVPEKQFLSASYALSLSIRDTLKSRRILESPQYQRWWGDRFRLTTDQNTKQKYENDRKGHRIATSVGGTITGEGGDIIIIDDPHNVIDTSSELKRQTALDWWDTAMSTRLNDIKTGSYVLIGQRVHHNDLFGHILERDQESWVHLNLPAEYEPNNKCMTMTGWTDPRKDENELLWPDRFGKKEISQLKESLGTYGASAQLQQRPTPEGGGIIKPEWFRYTREKPFTLMTIQAWDTAFKEGNSNDYSVCQTWLMTQDGYVLWDIWRDRISYPMLKKMAQARYDAERPSVVLIEDAASGQSLIQDLKSTHMPILPTRPDRDKVTRLNAVSPTIEAGKVYLREGTPWLADFLSECSQFPRGSHDDQVDAMVYALNYLRSSTISIDITKGADSLASKGDW